MKALNKDDQNLIYESQNQLGDNLKKIIFSITEVLENFENFLLVEMQKKVDEVRQLVFDAAGLAFIGGDGPILQVQNEQLDVLKETKLREISEELCNILFDLHSSFRLSEIKQKLVRIHDEIGNIHALT